MNAIKWSFAVMKDGELISGELYTDNSVQFAAAYTRLLKRMLVKGADVYALVYAGQCQVDIGEAEPTEAQRKKEREPNKKTKKAINAARKGKTNKHWSMENKE